MNFCRAVITPRKKNKKAGWESGFFVCGIAKLAQDQNLFYWRSLSTPWLFAFA